MERQELYDDVRIYDAPPCPRTRIGYGGRGSRPRTVVARGSLRFAATGGGGVAVVVLQDSTENAEVIRTVGLNAQELAEVVAELSPPPPRPGGRPSRVCAPDQAGTG